MYLTPQTLESSHDPTHIFVGRSTVNPIQLPWITRLVPENSNNSAFIETYWSCNMQLNPIPINWRQTHGWIIKVFVVLNQMNRGFDRLILEVFV